MTITDALEAGAIASFGTPAQVLLADPSLFPDTRRIYNFFGSNESQWTLLGAAIVIAGLPVVVLFVASQRQINHASLAGSVKG